MAVLGGCGLVLGCFYFSAVLHAFVTGIKDVLDALVTGDNGESSGFATGGF